MLRRRALRAHESFPRANLDRVNAPKVRKKEAKFLTHEQCRAFCVTANSWTDTHPHLGAMVRVWTECCCRPREALALRWADYADGVVSVRQALCMITNEPKELKTEQSRRDVPLSPEARGAVEAWRAACGKAAGPMFPKRRGGYPNYHTFLALVRRKLAKAAGLAGYTPYGLRHTGPSLLLANGASLLAVAWRMGHADVTLVLKTYGHTMPKDQGKLAALVSTLTPPR